MSRWWDVNVADASNALYSDPSLALQAAAVPDNMIQSQAQYKHDQDQARKDKGGFLSDLAHGLGKVDSWMSNVPGWGIAKQAVWQPIDKTAQGMYWAYSNVISQPISTLLLQAGKADLSGDWGKMFSGGEWADSYHHAEHISPGEAFMNYENTAEAQGKGTILSSFFGDAGQGISSAEKQQVKQSTDRFLYDSDYWRNKSNWKYNVGSGSIDFMFNVLDPVSGAAVGGVSKTVKAARSIELVPQAAEAAAKVPGAAGVARTRGPLLDLVMKQQTPEQVAQLPTMQKAFDWMKEPGRTTEEIANHPMFGRGRRINPARYDIAKLAMDTPRANMEQLWRFSAGDATAGKDLADQAPEVLKKMGQVADNRVLLAGTKMNPSMIATFKANYEGKAAEGVDPNLLVEPPTPRPTEPGPRQDGWDQTWGALQQQATVNRAAAAHIASTTPLRILSPAEDTSYADVMKAEEWKTGQMATMADDYDELVNNEKYLGTALGQMDNWTPAASPLFGTLSKSYRMGGLGIRSTESSAEAATLRSAGKKPASAGSNFMMTTVKRGMGVPMTIVHAFGAETPEGFVNHEATDARDRVFNMLKSVKGMEPSQRLDLIEKYNVASNKVERSQALTEIHDSVIDHILQKNEGMDAELASALRESIKNGISDKLSGLKGNGFNKAQRFGPTASTSEDMAKLTGDDVADDATTPIRSDRVVDQEDGHALVLSPLAQTQLSSNDILFPVKEIQRLASRSSSSMKTVRMAGGTVKDVLSKQLDGFDNLWKAATLLRPGFIPRMVSDEVLARMFKFGGMATLMDGTKGMAHFLSNRSRQVSAIVGKGSYVPGTGKGIASSHAFISLDDPELIAKAEARGDKTARIQVPATLRMAYGRISDEAQGLKDTAAELKTAQADEHATPEYIDSLNSRLADHQNTMDEYHDYVGEILSKAESSKGIRLGDGDFTYKLGGTTYRVPQAFSGEWDNPIPRDQISSENSWKNLFSRGEMLDRQRFWSHAEKTGAYKLVTPDDQNHMSSWMDAINKQIRQDPFHRMVAGGTTDKDALLWLNTTADGRKYMRNMGTWNQNKPQFVRSVRYMIDKYVGDDALKGKIANNEPVTEGELRTAFAPSEFPIVHGEEIKEHSSLTYRQTARALQDKYMDKAWKMVADVPADVLSRHPTYLQLHQAEMQNLIRQQYHYKMQNFGDDTISLREWDQMNNKADKLARGKMSQIVYDPVNTNGSQALRFVYPFFKPALDGADRWAGLVAERPEQLGKLAKIYNAPVAANLVTNQSGYHVDEQGNAYVPDTDKIQAAEQKLGRPLKPEELAKLTKKEFVPLSERVMHLKAPWAKPGGKELTSIRMASLNTILPGDPWFDPGAGPIVQVAGNQIAKSSPKAGEFMQWAKILPYGPQASTMDLLTPKYIKSVYDAYTAGDLNNEKYQQAVLDTYNLKVAQYHDAMKAGKHATPPSMDQIKKDAKSFLWLQALTDWAAPVSVKSSPLTGTKYQFFADQYKALQKADPTNARDNFLNMFGDEYFGFTDAISKSMGISASVTADKKMEQYRSLIEQDPDMAPLVVGDVYNGGPFSATIYQKQLNDEIGGVKVREKMTAEEAINAGRAQEGWHQYMKSMGILDGELIRAGFTSYTQKGAEQFAAYKSNISQSIANQNPAWAKAYGTTDRQQIPNRIRFMQQMVSDPALLNDPLRQDIKSLTAYLAVREQMKQQLAQRGLKQLSFDQAGQPTGQAADLGYAWRQNQMYFVNHSVGFSLLYNRYLSNDDLQ